MSSNESIAIKIITNMIETLAAAGWKAKHVFDGETTWNLLNGTAQTLDHVFSVAESQIIFENMAGRQHWVHLIISNGIDVISDYSTALHHADNFGDVMDEVQTFVEDLELQEAA